MKAIEVLRIVLNNIREEQGSESVYLPHPVLIHRMENGKSEVFTCDLVEYSSCISFQQVNNDGESGYVGTSEFDPFLTDEDIYNVISAI